LSEARIVEIPSEIYAQTHDWAREAANGNSKIENELFQVIYPKETIHFDAPNGCELPGRQLNWTFKDAFVAVIPNGRVLSTGYIITPENKRLGDVELPLSYPIKVLSPTNYTSETVASLIWGESRPEIKAFTQNNYGHWLLDILSRIHLLEKSGLKIDKYVTGELLFPHQYESLELLGIKESQLIQIDHPSFHLQAQQLVVTAVPRLLGSGAYPRWIYEYYRKLFASHDFQTMEGFERIYISRKDASARFVLNEDEVMEVLVKKGFKKIILSGMSFMDQIRLFSSARVIVSSVGANLTNVLFCQPATKIIELSPQTMKEVAYWQLSSYAKLEFHQIICNIEQPPKSTGGKDNLIVDIHKLLEMLEGAGV
jgi:hypothetical protein